MVTQLSHQVKDQSYAHYMFVRSFFFGATYTNNLLRVNLRGKLISNSIIPVHLHDTKPLNWRNLFPSGLISLNQYFHFLQDNFWHQHIFVHLYNADEYDCKWYHFLYWPFRLLFTSYSAYFHLRNLWRLWKKKLFQTWPCPTIIANCPILPKKQKIRDKKERLRQLLIEATGIHK